jgi:hypothetical protein
MKFILKLQAWHTCNTKLPVVNHRSIVAMPMNVMRRNDADAGQMLVTKKL